jgi:hypothetical protein
VRRKRIQRSISQLLVVALLVQLLTLFPSPVQPGVGYAAPGEQEETATGYDPTSIGVQDAVYTSNVDVVPMLYATSDAAAGSIHDYKWEKVTGQVLVPEARHSAAMAYDEAAGKVVLFGGANNTEVLLDDTWIWDGVEQKWQEVNLTGVTPPTPNEQTPPKRKGAVIVYDPGSGRVLLFGGQGEAGALNDTWLWDGATQTWEEVSVSGGPPKRSYAQMAYYYIDAGQGLQGRVVLFGGIDGSTILGDTWVWDGAARTWTQQTPNASPPPLHTATMAFDGTNAILYGGDAGPVVNEPVVGHPLTPTSVSYEKNNNQLWIWDGTTWNAVRGPEQYRRLIYDPSIQPNNLGAEPYDYGRWAHVMAYDGRRVVYYGGETEWVNYSSYFGWQTVRTMRPENGRIDYFQDNVDAVFAWRSGNWETVAPGYSSSNPPWQGFGHPFEAIAASDTGPYEVPTYNYPLPRNYASMAFDGTNFVMFGGKRTEFVLKNSLFASVLTAPYEAVNETWTFGYTPPAPPSVKMVGEPFIAYDPTRVNDTVSVITDVYGDGNRTITARGVQYRLVADPEAVLNEWTNQPYTVSTGNIGTFTIALTNLVWQQEYEVRGYATSELGTSYTDIARFKLENHPNVLEPDVKYDRVGPSVLHVKDKIRLVAVGTGIFDLLRKPTNLIDYYLEDESGTKYPLAYNIKDARQLELTLQEPLPPGTYDVHLKHGYFYPYDFEDALLVTDLDFYKPRLFDSVTVPSTSAQNEASILTLQGMFTEKPSAPKVYELNDPSEPMLINDSVMFKGSRLEVDKSGLDGKTIIRGNGRLYVNAAGPAGTLPYTMVEGEWTLSSDRFGFDIANQPEADYLSLGMPIHLQTASFTASGLRFDGEMQIGFWAGSEKIGAAVPIDSLTFRNNRFELSGSYELQHPFKLGPFDVDHVTTYVDSRYNHVGMTAAAKLPDTAMPFTLNLRTKQGRLDAYSFGSDKPAELGSSGIKIGYVFGQAEGLEKASSIPQQAATNGSVSDTLVPEIKLGGSQSYPMIRSVAQPIRMTPYGLTSEGTQNLYFVPFSNAWMIGVANPQTAFTQGFSIPGFRTQGELNAYGIIEGLVHFVGNERDGLAGQLKATIHVPEGIPHVGGATAKDVLVTIESDKMYGSFKHNNVGVTLLYTFRDNTILFELKLPPPKPPAWMTAMDIFSTVMDVFGALDKFSSEVRILAAPTTTFSLTRTGKTMQPAAQNVKAGVSARIVDGKLTAYRQNIPLQAELNSTDDGATYRFPVKLTHTGWIALTGDQRDAVIRLSASGANASAGVTKDERYYRAASDTTYIRADLDRVGKWELMTKRPSGIALYELLYANGELGMEELGGLWEATLERPVTAVTIEERGAFWLELGAGSGETLLYKHDGRPYRLQTTETEADWNTLRADDGALSVLLEATRPGTWLLDSGSERHTALYSVPSETEISDTRTWLDSNRYPTGFTVGRTDTNQAVVEIYGADEHTQLYAPNGNAYPLEPQKSNAGWNAVYDPIADKLTVLLDGTALAGEWKVSGTRFVDVVVYKTSRKLKSPEPLQAEGTHKIALELPEAGDYVLALSGAGMDTVITAPGDKAFPLVFDEQSLEHNAFLQLEQDRRPATGGNSDVQVDMGSGTIRDVRDTLYITLRNAAAGKWTIQTSERISWEISELPRVPEFTQASASAANGSGNQLRLEWTVSPASPDTEVAVMLTDSADRLIGERIASGLPAAGRTTIDLPEGLIPGQYRVALVAQSDEWAPIYALAEGTVTVQSYASLSAPGQPTVQSVGNGEVTLTFPSAAGPVMMYRIWASANGDMQPLLDMAPAAGATQQAVIAGLPVGQTHTFAVSALANDAGRLSVSPLSPTIQAEIVDPQPAALSVTLDAGSSVVKQRTYMAYDGGAETLLSTSAEQATLQVTADQSATFTVTVDGKTSLAQQAAAGTAAAFPLAALLEVASLSERVYELTIEARNGQGDRTIERVKLLVDRTVPMLVASNGLSSTGQQQQLNGVVVFSSHLYMTGQTDPGAKLTFDGQLIPLDDYGKFGYNATMSWGVSEERKTLALIATDEAGNETEHRFEVLRGQAGNLPSVSMSLRSLTVTGGKLAISYQPAQTNYMVTPTAEQVRINVMAANAETTVSIDGQDVGSEGYADITVPPTGKNVVVAVQSGQTYMLQLGGYRSSVAALQSLELRDAAEDAMAAPLPAPYFSGGESSYTVYVEREVDSVTLTPQAVQAGATISVAGQAVTGGQASAPLSLQTGDNPVTVVVTAPDQTTQKTYQITVQRAQNNNARLQQLELSGATAEMLPTFSPEVRVYRATVPYGASSLTVLATAEQPDADIRIDGQSVTSGATHQVMLNSQSRTILVEVEAEDGTQLAYSIVVGQQQADPGTPPRLSELSVTNGKLDVDFSPYRRVYRVGSTTQSVESVSAAANDPDAVVTVNGAAPGQDGTFASQLAYGDNLLVIQVESADGKASEVYSVGIERLRDNSGSSNTPQDSTAERTVIAAGENGAWTIPIAIVRTSNQRDQIIDTIKLDSRTARDIVDKARQAGHRTVYLHMDDLPEAPADERLIRLDADSVQALAAGSLMLVILLPEGRILVGEKSLSEMGAAGREIYWRIVPVREASERSGIENRAHITGQGIKILGSPVRIETNYTGFTTGLVFPLSQLQLPQDKDSAQHFLSQLAVYIEHSDGEKTLQPGKIQYDEQGLAELAIEIDKFSTFTIVRVTDGEEGDRLEPYLSGYPDGTFRPERSITRAEMAAMLYRLLVATGVEMTQLPDTQQTGGGYDDVSASHWASGQIAALQRLGIMLGDPNGHFRPNAFVTRAEIAVIGVRWTNAVPEAVDPPVAVYSDVNGHWAAQAISLARSAGWMLGYPDGTFRPDKPLTRAETVKTINRLIGRPASPETYSSSWPDVPNSHWALADIESASSLQLVRPDDNAAQK